MLKSGRLSGRLYSMYAKELFISGTLEDFTRAEPWFLKRLEQEGLSRDARYEAVCVLAKGLSMRQKWEELLSLCLMELAGNSALPAELFFLLGQYYEARERYLEAVYWYKRAALEAECYVCISYGGAVALEEAIRLLKQLGLEEEAVQYEALLA